MFWFRNSIFFILIFQLVGCATIFHGSVENIEISSTVDNTRVYVNDEYLGTAGPDAPLEITIPKRGEINIVGKKENCQEDEVEVKRTIDPTTLLGILIDGGVISILFIDNFGSGAIRRAKETLHILELKCRS